MEDTSGACLPWLATGCTGEHERLLVRLRCHARVPRLPTDTTVELERAPSSIWRSFARSSRERVKTGLVENSRAISTSSIFRRIEIRIKVKKILEI